MHVAAENWKAKCLACGEEVTFTRDEQHPNGNWQCSKLPKHHKVQERTYFHLGGAHIQNWRERRGWGPQIILRAGYSITDPRTGVSSLEPTVRIWFSGQQLTTEDPEIQFLLETKNDACIAWGEEGKKNWQRIYLTQEQQKDLANAELESLNRQIRDGNALLADVQSRSKSKQTAAAS
jgi:hypothetical protein